MRGQVSRLWKREELKFCQLACCGKGWSFKLYSFKIYLKIFGMNCYKKIVVCSKFFSEGCYFKNFEWSLFEGEKFVYDLCRNSETFLQNDGGNLENFRKWKKKKISAEIRFHIAKILASLASAIDDHVLGGKYRNPPGKFQNTC